MGKFSVGSSNLKGDEDAAGYHLLTTEESPTLSLVLDTATQIVWSGHKDGKLRAWPAQVDHTDLQTQKMEEPILTWQGHRSGITAIVVTPYGEVWTGSESGSMRAWSCEVISSGLMWAAKGDFAACALLTNASILLRGPAISAPLQTEVLFLVAEHSHCCIWAGELNHITLWDARTRETVNVITTSAYADPRNIQQKFAEPGAELPYLDEDKKKGYAAMLKKHAGCLQRSKYAVHRAAARVQQGSEESRQLEALAASADGTVWGGMGNGLLVQWDADGTRLRELTLPPIGVGVKSIVAVGRRLWIGYANGMVQVMANSKGRTLGAWGAHRKPVVQMARGGDFVFSLGANGGIRGWHVASPSPFDIVMYSELSAKAGDFTRQRLIRILVGTWNVGQAKAKQDALEAWLTGPAADVNLVCVGLQEFDMGASAIGRAAVSERVGLGYEETVTDKGQKWLDQIGSAIGVGIEFEQVSFRELAGLLVGVWVRKRFLPFVGDVDATAVACGFGRTLGNKGAVAVKMSIFRRTFCLVNSHLAAHQDKVAARNADFEYIYSQMVFGSRVGAAAIATASAAKAYGGSEYSYLSRWIPSCLNGNTQTGNMAPSCWCAVQCKQKVGICHA